MRSWLTRVEGVEPSSGHRETLDGEIGGATPWRCVEVLDDATWLVIAI